MKGGLRGQTIFQEPSEPNEPISYTEINSQENDSITYIKFDGQDMPVFGRDIEPNMDIINQVLKERLGITEDENFTLDDDDQVVIPWWLSWDLDATDFYPQRSNITNRTNTIKVKLEKYLKDYISFSFIV